MNFFQIRITITDPKLLNKTSLDELIIKKMYGIWGHFEIDR